MGRDRDPNLVLRSLSRATGFCLRSTSSLWGLRIPLPQGTRCSCPWRSCPFISNQVKSPVFQPQLGERDFPVRGHGDFLRTLAFVPCSFLFPQLEMLNLMEYSEPQRRNKPGMTNTIFIRGRAESPVSLPLLLLQGACSLRLPV